jgi:DNA-binding transcriptional LysR family regulator
VDLSRLQVFVAVARDKSFSRAASRLGLPKSSVSREITRLEEEVGARLLHRTTRQVGLSTAGHELLERVGPLLEQLEQAVGDLPERELEPSGLLRVTTTVDVGEALLSEVVTRFVERYPRVRVELLLTPKPLDLVAEGIDLALRLSAQPRLADSSLTARVLGPWTIEAFASPKYLARRGTPTQPRDLVQHHWVSVRGMPLPEGVGEPRILADDMFCIRGALRAGAGIGFMPTYLGRSDIENGTLVRVLPEMMRKNGSIWVVYPGGREVPRKVAAFRDMVLTTLRGPLDAG